MVQFCFAVLLFLPTLAAQTRSPLQLSLSDAVERALSPEGNARIQIARELVRQAESRSVQARGTLLPDISAAANFQNQTRNLAAFGIRPQIPVPGFLFPEFVGPFSTIDFRATGGQTILDLSAMRRYKASRAGISVSRAEEESARDQIAEQVARIYLTAMRAEAAQESAKANLALAEALSKLASDQKSAGTATGLDTTRAEVQIANERQRLLIAGNERTRAHLQLARALGFQLDQSIELTDRLEYTPGDVAAQEEALASAMKSRADLKAQQEREQVARLNFSAVRMERFPSLAGFGDYGTIGTSIGRTLPTRTVGISLRVPIFDGGRKDARRAEAASQLRQEEIRTRDLREQADLEIRLALDALRSAENQVKVAQEGLALARNELGHARRRYEAGVGSSIEVTDAQTRLERAGDNHIGALFNHNLARLDLAAARGAIQSFVLGTRKAQP